MSPTLPPDTITELPSDRIRRLAAEVVPESNTLGDTSRYLGSVLMNLAYEVDDLAAATASLRVPESGIGRGNPARDAVNVARELIERFPHDLRVGDVLLVLDALERVDCGHDGDSSTSDGADAPAPADTSVEAEGGAGADSAPASSPSTGSER